MINRITLDKSKLLFTRKALIALILPLMMEQFLTVLVGMADSIMIASVGEAAVSGVSLVDNVFILILQVLTALATGGAVVIGQYLGSRSAGEARRAAEQLMGFLFVFSLAITAFMYLGQDFILHGVFGAISDEVYGHARTYLLICSAAIPGIALYCGVAAIYRTQGDSATPMRIAIVMNAINVCGNALLIYGLHFGTAGVAIPTLASRVVAAIIGLVILRHPNKAVYLDQIRHFRFNGGMIRRILRIGIPSGVENSLFQIGKLVVLGLITTFGTSAIAANAVSMAVANFMILPGMSMGYAMVTVVSRCAGAGDAEQAKYYVRRLMGLTYLSMWVMTILILAVLPGIMILYNLTPETAETATRILWTHGIMDMLIWPISFTLPNAFRAMGNAAFPMVVSILSMVLARIVFSYIFAQGLGLGVWGTWLAMILDWAVRSVVFVIYYFKGNKMHRVVLERH